MTTNQTRRSILTALDLTGTAGLARRNACARRRRLAGNADGAHLEVFARYGIRTIADLKSRNVSLKEAPTERYDQVLRTLKDVLYGNCRECDAEDTIRFYSLRMHDAGRIRSSPQKIIANTNGPFLRELKRELKVCTLPLE